MIRLIKRYGGGSRKLYDTEESRYVSLEEIGAWVRAGQEVQVVDSTSGEDVTSSTLAQSLYEDQKRGASLLTAEFLHQAIRKGGQALAETVGQAQARFDTFMQTSVAEFAGVRPLQEEMAVLRRRLEELETSLAELEAAPARPAARRRVKSTTQPTRKPRARRA